MQKLKQILLSLFFFRFLLFIIYLVFKKKIRFKNPYYLHCVSNYIFINFHPVKNISTFFYAYKDFTKKFIPKKNDIILDVGAGLGSEMLIFSKRVGLNGKVICLEPDPRLFKVLECVIEVNKLKNVILYKKAFYNKNNLKINFTLNPIYNWMANNSLSFPSNAKNYRVSTITIDKIIKDNKLHLINFAKFNIEGAEKYLISGNKKFLKKCKNIVVSCHDFLNKKEYQTYQTVKKVLNDHSFKIHQSKSDNNILKYFLFATKTN